MFSVLIQNKKTMESFGKFHPLFSETIARGELGVCQWIEAGRTVDEALPELVDMVEKKESWRAVVVRIQDEEDGKLYPTERLNPYDFQINHKKEDREENVKIRESTIPLIRLTQMLGGVPVPEARFEAKILKEDGKNPRVIYEPFIDPEDAKEHKRLSEQYKLKTKAPEEIVLITLCAQEIRREDYLNEVWQNRRELDSSRFWRRNQYPGSCRFTYCEEQEEGENRRTADLFRFWTVVLLMASNSMDPSTLQAYKLHRLSVEFDREEMKRIMQNSMDRAGQAIHVIKESMKRDAKKRLEEGSEIPEYYLHCPVELPMPEKGDFYVSTLHFGLFSRSESSDMAKWKESKRLSDRGVAVTLVRAERALDQSADHIRNFYEYSEDEVKPLNGYSRMDFEESLEELFDDIFTRRSGLPGNGGSDQEKEDQLAERVRDTIFSRMTRHRALGVYGAAAVFSLACMAPALIILLLKQWGSLAGVLLAFAVCAGSFALVELVVLLVRRGVLRRRIDEYNCFVHGIVVNITENASAYSEYMSAIASYMRGNSYLNITRRKKFLKDEAKFHKKNHMDALKKYREELKLWSEALYLPVSFDAEGVDENLYVDVRIPPYSNPLYTFENGESYQIPVNHAGDFVCAPFGFIRRLSISREELYDDASCNQPTDICDGDDAHTMPAAKAD